MKSNGNPPVSQDALCASSNIDHRETVCLSSASFGSMENTHKGGNLLGVVRPHWIKVTESEQRIAWLKKMISMKLVVREIDSYAKSIRDKLRSEKCKLREEERDILMGIMKLKLKDETKNLLELKRRKDEKMDSLKNAIVEQVTDSI